MSMNEGEWLITYRTYTVDMKLNRSTSSIPTDDVKINRNTFTISIYTGIYRTGSLVPVL